jgi:putative phosphoribosyl transferase
MFVDRRDAGSRLGARLCRSVPAADVVVLGLPRGGVPVAFEVARTLGAPLDVIVVRKLGVPFDPELGFGAVGEEGAFVLNRDVIWLANLTLTDMTAVEERERTELQCRVHRYRGGRPPVELTGRTVIVVDDGIATGGTAQAACQVARARGAARVVLAVPVGEPGTIADLRDNADEVICLETPEDFYAIGSWYADFTQTTDEQVAELLRKAQTGEEDQHDDSTGHHAPGRRVRR